MDQEGFRAYLKERKISQEEIDASIRLAQRFVQFARHHTPPNKGDLLSFSKLLIENQENSIANYYALARFAFFTDNQEVYIAAVDLLDGSEALENFFYRAENVLGAEKRDAIFEGIELPKLGLPNAEKVQINKIVMSRLVEIADSQECDQILSDSLRDLDESWYAEDKKLYQECASVDEFLDKNAENFIAHLEKLRDEGKPFFTQYITNEVVDYVRSEPLIARGLREGDLLYEVKIPHQTQKYLAESDPTKKRYHYCHCPWVKKSLEKGASDIPVAFCKCSTGFHKKKWEALLGQKLKAEIIESVLQGNDWCKIAIHLPEGLP